MIRRPRFPLALRLGWIEAELGHAARLLPMMIEDQKGLLAGAEAAEARLVMVAGLACAALMLLGLDPRTLEAFMEQIGPDGSLEEAEALGADILAQAVLLLVPEEGEG